LILAQLLKYSDLLVHETLNVAFALGDLTIQGAKRLKKQISVLIQPTFPKKKWEKQASSSTFPRVHSQNMP
jgi:hypothetical protein